MPKKQSKIKKRTLLREMVNESVTMNKEAKSVLLKIIPFLKPEKIKKLAIIMEEEREGIERILKAVLSKSNAVPYPEKIREFKIKTKKKIFKDFEDKSGLSEKLKIAKIENQMLNS